MFHSRQQTALECRYADEYHQSDLRSTSVNPFGTFPLGLSSFQPSGSCGLVYSAIRCEGSTMMLRLALCYTCYQKEPIQLPAKPFFFIMGWAGVIHLPHCCRHLHQLLDMPTHTPNMVNMMMQTRAVSGSSPSQDVPAALTSQLGAETDLAQHTQQLGEPSYTPMYYEYIAGALKRATQDCTYPVLGEF